MIHKETLLQKFNDRSATIGIIGLGYVGLPLAVSFAEAGFTVIGLDVNTAKVNKINAGTSYIPDIPTAQMAPLVAAGKLRATVNYDDLSVVDAVSICVPTPLNHTREPDMSYVVSATDGIVGVAHAGMLIVLESTTYPGTTEEVVYPRLELHGLIPGVDVHVAFSPERIDPGNEKFGVRNTPKVVGGLTPDCQDVAAAYYGTIVENVVQVSSPAAAEMVKLLENTFRAVNIGLANEMALMCGKLGIDVWEVIKAASSKPFGFMAFYPGPGIGGHCIPIDPLYLSWKLKEMNYTAQFIETATRINTYMPEHVVERIADALNERCLPIRGSKIVLLGVAYKKDIDDVRESPALDIIKLLMKKGAEISYHDPHVPAVRLEDGSTLRNHALTDAWLHEADCAVIITDHTDMDWQHIIHNTQMIVDTRNVTPKYHKNGTMIVKI
jgi:UDP-N-acetyl-D-glucosamine dehydrogenase